MMSFYPQWCYDRFISVQISKTGYLKNYLYCFKVFAIRKSDLFENYKDGWVRRYGSAWQQSHHWCDLG